MATQVVIRGTVTADGTLQLAEPVKLPPGPVEVTVMPRTHTPRSAADIDADIRQMRDEWEEHQLALERMHEECRRQGRALPGKETSP